MPLLEDYDWEADRETERFATPDPPKRVNDPRSPFDRDRDRIIHSVAFRRLQGKTQIFAPSAGGDFTRTRVTHSIEVAQIGRAMAKRLGIPEGLAEAACLGHDLGHPPFGHTGEAMLNKLMLDFGGFEGNAQSFRIVTRLEKKDPDYFGLDLCRATLHSLVKYPYRRSSGSSKFIYDDDAELYEPWLFDGLKVKLVENGPVDPPRSAPCQLMDWADDIAYSVHDLEDGIAGGLLQPATLTEDWFLESICTTVERTGETVGVEADFVEGVLQDLAGSLKGGVTPRVPLDIMRKVTRDYIDEFATAGHFECSGEGDNLFDFKLEIPPEIRAKNEVLKAITRAYVIDDARTRGFAFKGKEIVRRLFKAHKRSTQAQRDERYLLFPHEMRNQLEGRTEEDAARIVCDYLAGMTEGQAIQLYSRLFEPSGGPLVENV